MDQTLLIISQNMEEKPFLPEGSRYTIKGTPTIVVVCTQEEFGLGTTVLKNLPNTYTLKQYVTINDTHSGLGTADKNVKMIIYGLPAAWTSLTKGFIPIASKESGIIGFAERVSRPFVTNKKGATWIQVERPNGDSFLFINLHLPMLGSDKRTLGNDYRVKIFKKILTDLSSQITKATSVFITGDLNFRIEADGHNQLTTLLESELTQFKDITPPNYTCSFKNPTGEGSTEDCRLQTVDTPLRNTTCFHEKPLRKSRCDRILISKKPTQVPKISIKTFVMDPSLDHNGLEAIFSLSPPAPPAPFKKFNNTISLVKKQLESPPEPRMSFPSTTPTTRSTTRYTTPAPAPAPAPIPAPAPAPAPASIPPFNNFKKPPSTSLAHNQLKRTLSQTQKFYPPPPPETPFHYSPVSSPSSSPIPSPVPSPVPGSPSSRPHSPVSFRPSVTNTDDNTSFTMTNPFLRMKKPSPSAASKRFNTRKARRYRKRRNTRKQY